MGTARGILTIFGFALSALLVLGGHAQRAPAGHYSSHTGT